MRSHHCQSDASVGSAARLARPLARLPAWPLRGLVSKRTAGSRRPFALKMKNPERPAMKRVQGLGNLPCAPSRWLEITSGCVPFFGKFSNHRRQRYQEKNERIGANCFR